MKRSEMQSAEPSGCLNAQQVEQLFCLALLGEGTDVVQRVTSRFIEYRDNPSPQVAAMMLAIADNALHQPLRGRRGAADAKSV